MLYYAHMVIGACQITLHLPGCHSLKEKRQIVKSVVTRVRNQFSVAIAEVEELDRWQITKIGISYVSNDAQHAREVLDHARRYIEETRPDILLTHAETEVFHW
ncbi:MULTISPECIES: DUF503 domain-containing protein [Ktedonobacter]|uniref:DUF503 domain-containing protein n=1 Tax=Ktedonobacter TaxID=363276 RepID=UPI0027DAFFEE|nr:MULTISPECIES: DUF503 domain-containing protein [Ktedonobacter]